MAREKEAINSTLQVLKNLSELSDSLQPLKRVVDELSQDSISFIEIRSVSDYKYLLTIVNNVSAFGLVKDFPGTEDRDYDKRDFEGVADSAKECFVCLKYLLSKLHIINNDQKLLQSMLISILKLCATHSQVFPWSSDDAACFSKEIFQAALQLAGSTGVATLLCHKAKGCNVTLFKAVLLSIRPSLTKQTWTRNPSTCQIFKWLLFHVKHPYLSDYLCDILPPSLMFIDHHAVRNKVLGIQCLEFIIDNVPPTELKMYGRADVVYDALSKLIYMRESDIICVLYPCILKLMSGLEKSHSDPNHTRKWCHCDDVYHQFLWNMESEDNIVARREMSLVIGLFIEHLGITVVKHLKRTMRVLLTFLSVCEGPEEISRINALKALSLLVKIAWPRMEYHCEDIMKSILFLVYDVETESATTIPHVKQILLACCKECLLYLQAACPSKVKVLMSSLDGIDKSIPGIQFAHSVYEENSKL